MKTILDSADLWLKNLLRRDNREVFLCNQFETITQDFYQRILLISYENMFKYYAKLNSDNFKFKLTNQCF